MPLLSLNNYSLEISIVYVLLCYNFDILGHNGYRLLNFAHEPERENQEIMLKNIKKSKAGDHVRK